MTEGPDTTPLAVDLSTALAVMSPATRQLLATTSTDCHLDLYRAQLRTHVLTLEREIAAVKYRHNAIAPISYLPAETLSRIFVAVRDMVMHRWYRSPTRTSWILVTHVCRYWRNVALNCASLWSDIREFMHPGLLEASITRARDSLLSVDFTDLNHGDRCESLKRALSRTGRLHSLSLIATTDRRRILQDVLSSCSDNAPALERLSLIWTGKGRLTLPQGLGPGGAPALKKLSIRDCGLAWSSLPFASTLTELSLSGRTGKCRPGFTEFLCSIQLMRNLQKLSLTGYLPLSTPQISGEATPPPSPLSALRTLCLCDIIPSIDIFYKAVRMPPSAQATLDFVDDEYDDLLTRNVLEGISTCWRGENGTGSDITSHSVRTMLLTESKGFSEYQVAIWRKLSWDDSFDWDSPDLGINLPNDEPFTPRLLRSLKQYLDLAFLHRLEIESTATWTKLDWSTSLDIGECLMIVRIVGHPSLLTSLLDVLRDDVTSAMLFFPSLHTLEIAEMNLQGGDDSDPIGHLIQVLEWREREGFPVSVLELEDCLNFKESHLQRILRVCPHMKIDWYGPDGEHRHHSPEQSAEDASEFGGSREESDEEASEGENDDEDEEDGLSPDT